MLKVIRNEQEALGLINGTSLAGYIDTDYMGLELALGDPTFDTESGDGKVQVEWVCKFLGNTFTIYDWKTYDRDFTLCELDRFNIGSKARGYEVAEFIEFLNDLIVEAYERVEDL
jgi:extradiol dioxygenase family protein